jgi:lipoprotein-anchoring transpeptidase ErfK/SrfK
VQDRKLDRAVVVLGALIALIGATGVLRVGLEWPAPARAEALRAATRPAVTLPLTSTTLAAAAPSGEAAVGGPVRAPFPALQVPPQTPLAAPNGTIQTFARPGAAASGTVGTWYGVPVILPVVATSPGWVQVRLPQRPNQSTTWVRATDVTMSSTRYYLAISLSATQLMVYRDGRPIYDFPVGVGLPATPTPLGHFFVAIREVGTSAFYGPVILDTSAHSEAIKSWEGLGDAIVAVHGPITSAADAQIGTTGTRISNGCIRLHNSDLVHLAEVPAGTPLDIIP